MSEIGSSVQSFLIRSNILFNKIIPTQQEAKVLELKVMWAQKSL